MMKTEKQELSLIDAIFKHCPLEIIVVDKVGRITKFNFSNRKLGVELPNIGDLMYVDYASFHHSDMYAELMDCINSKELKIFRELNYGKKVLSITIAPFKEGAVILSQDISNQIQLYEVMRESEEKYRLIAENTADIISVLDLDFKLSYVSPAVFQVRGYSVKEAISQSIDQIVTPESLLVIKKLLAEELAIEKTKTADPKRTRIIELEEYCKDGSTVWVESHLHFLRDKDGTAVGVISVSRDISNRKLLEEKLRLQLRAIEATVDGLAILDSNEIILYSNSSYCKIHGYAGDNLIGKSWRLLYNNEELQKFYQDIFPRLRKNGYIYERATGRKKDGTQFPQGLTLTLLENGRMICVVRDISERIAVEKILEDTERMRTVAEMSAGVAHDFNNTLQVIIGNIELALLYQTTPDESRQYMNIAKKSAINSAALVRQLLRFTKKESKNFYTAVDLNALLDDAINQIRPLWKDREELKGREFEFLKNYGIVDPIDGDNGQITSVFLNILKNAIEAMPMGGTISLSTVQTDQGVIVKIQDTGVGMDSETKKRIFQPYYTTKGYNLGRGLGMTSVYSVISSHGAEITVHDGESGKGSMIKIIFPVGKQSIGQAHQKKLAQDHISARILWVDDEEPIRDLALKFVESLGHFADVVGSGKEALEYLEKNHYDLLITDLEMTEMSGRQLAEIIKGRYNEMKVVVVTGGDPFFSEKEKAKYGIAYIIGKPINMLKLKNLIGEVLQSKI